MKKENDAVFDDLMAPYLVVKYNGLLTRIYGINITLSSSVTDIPACVTGGGSMFRVHMKAEIPTTYRAAYMTPKNP